MPFLTIQIAKGHSIELKQKLVQALTEALVSTLGTKPEKVTIHIDEFDLENLAVGGQLHSENLVRSISNTASIMSRKL